MVIRRFVFGFMLLLVTTLGLVNYTHAQAVIQSYNTTAQLHVGTIVKLQDKNTNYVEPATQVTANRMLGIVVNANVSPVTLTQAVSSSQAYVATSGKYTVLVDNQNGPINVGDYITVSSLAGIGYKATDNDLQVLGKAVTSFKGTADSIGPVTVKNLAGHDTTLQLGLITVEIGITHNPSGITNSGIPFFLLQAGRSIANKPVSNLRLYMAVTMLVLSAIITGILLFAGIRGSMTAIGRNPLSKKTIMRSLLQVILTSIVVFLIGLFAVYLLLKV